MDYRKYYSTLIERIDAGRNALQRPLTLTDKILLGHMRQAPSNLSAGESIMLYPARVNMQEATAQMAVLQAIAAGMKGSAVPASFHYDHLALSTNKGAEADLKRAGQDHEEVFDFLERVGKAQGIDVWKLGSGIIHDIVLRVYAIPGMFAVGTDSHSGHGAGLGAAIPGVGGNVASNIMLGNEWMIDKPKTLGVHLVGQLSAWATPKEIITELCRILGREGGKGYSAEYFGPGLDSIPATGIATCGNMGVEPGLRWSTASYTAAMGDFLRATQRKDVASIVEKNIGYYRPDVEVLQYPESHYDKVIEINLSELKPQMCGPFDVGVVRYPNELEKAVSSWSRCEVGDGDTIVQQAKDGGLPPLSYGQIGSCTQSSWGDLLQVSQIAQWALDNDLNLKVPVHYSPGSSQLKITAEEYGLLDPMRKLGIVITAPSCAACIGKWERPEDWVKGTANTVVASFNRPFAKRFDGDPSTIPLVTSPLMVMLVCLSGKIGFDPSSGSLEGTQLPEVPTSNGIPENGFLPFPAPVYEFNSGYNPDVDLSTDPNSERIALLDPFTRPEKADLGDAVILFKGAENEPFTTDGISPAGAWLNRRGHLPKISENYLTGGTLNVFTGKADGTVLDLLGSDGATGLAHDVALKYRDAKQPWIAVGDTMVGEGSSREHAAMTPKYLGCNGVFARSFASIHQENLREMGVLAMVFENSADYSVFEAHDKVNIVGIENLAVGSEVYLMVHRDGKEPVRVNLVNDMNQRAIDNFWSGGWLNKALDDGKAA